MRTLSRRSGRLGRWILLAPLACAPGCRQPASTVPGGGTGALAFLAGGDTTVVDEYLRTPEELNGEVRFFSPDPGGARARAEYRVRYRQDGRPESAHLTIGQVGPAGLASSEVHEWSATFGGDGTVMEVESGSGRWARAAAGADAVPLFGPSIAMLEAVLLRARRTSATSLPVFHLAAGGRVDTAVIAWFLPDSVHLTIAGARGSYRLDEAGRIVSGAAAGEDLRTVRLR